MAFVNPNKPNPAQKQTLPTAENQAPAYQPYSNADFNYRLSEILSEYGPEEIEAMMNLERANQLRNTPAPEMRGNSRIQTAANPLEFAGNLAQRYVAEKEGFPGSIGQLRTMGGNIRSRTGGLRQEFGNYWDEQRRLRDIQQQGQRNAQSSYNAAGTFQPFYSGVGAGGDYQYG
jgi:hypothetical protein